MSPAAQPQHQGGLARPIGGGVTLCPRILPQLLRPQPPELDHQPLAGRWPVGLSVTCVPLSRSSRCLGEVME